jgi:hypothetical protein
MRERWCPKLLLRLVLAEQSVLYFIYAKSHTLKQFSDSPNPCSGYKAYVIDLLIEMKFCHQGVWLTFCLHLSLSCFRGESVLGMELFPVCLCCFCFCLLFCCPTSSFMNPKALPFCPQSIVPPKLCDFSHAGIKILRLLILLLLYDLQKQKFL